MAKLSYASADVVNLFNDMARTYGAVNLLSSFGFSHFWRKICIHHLAIESTHCCADLMCGMGEASSLMIRKGGKDLRVDAVDFSPEMTKRCTQMLLRFNANQSKVDTRNVFELISKSGYDRICCSFGLKTLDDSQLRLFAGLIKNLLKADGRAVFVEIHVPSKKLWRLPYLFYIRHVIPFIGRLCLGDPDCYRHLALYTEDYARRDFFGMYLREVGLNVNEHSLFLGCAKLYVAQQK